MFTYIYLLTYLVTYLLTYLLTYRSMVSAPTANILRCSFSYTCATFVVRPSLSHGEMTVSLISYCCKRSVGRYSTVNLNEIFGNDWAVNIVPFLQCDSWRCCGFYRASSALAVYAMVVCPSVCLSVTSRCSTKMAKHRNTQTTPHDSPGTLVFWC